MQTIFSFLQGKPAVLWDLEKELFKKQNVFQTAFFIFIFSVQQAEVGAYQFVIQSCGGPIASLRCFQIILCGLSGLEG